MQRLQKEGPSGLLVDLVRGSGTPATFTLCASAIILSVGGWTKPGLEPFVLDARGFESEPWRLLSCHFVHVNIIHLWFNLSWVWFLGREIERRLGAPFLIGTSLFMMLGTSAVVQAFDRGGIGLSGVVYGLWALVFVGQRRCEMLRGILDARANQLMVAWFFFCIIATMSGAFPVSNWGHGAGAVLGALVGLGIAEDGRMRPVSLPLGAALLALITCGATIWYPSWNFGGAAIEFERAGDKALETADWKTAETALREAVRIDPQDGRAWWNLDYVLAKLDRGKEAVEAGYRSFECGDLDARSRKTLHEQLRWVIDMCEYENDQRAAFSWSQRAVKFAPADKSFWADLLGLAETLGEKQEAQRARDALAKLGSR